VCCRDQRILSHLTELTVEENEDVKSGYRISLAFDANPFFHNALLEKRLSWPESGGELTMQTTAVLWKPGQVQSSI
jgi:template-activating factor I